MRMVIGGTVSPASCSSFPRACMEVVSCGCCG
jgi:hypothetical protein